MRFDKQIRIASLPVVLVIRFLHGLTTLSDGHMGGV